MKRCRCGYCEDPSDCPAARGPEDAVVKLHVSPRGGMPFVLSVVNTAAVPLLLDLLRQSGAVVTWNDDEERRVA